jgi:hypothetical protein
MKEKRNEKIPADFFVRSIAFWLRKKADLREDYCPGK